MKKILLVGSNSFIAQQLKKTEQKDFYFISANRKPTADELFLDLENEKSIHEFSLNEKIDGVIFCAGINPSKNLNESSASHFHLIYQINIAAPAMLLQVLQNQFNANPSILFFNSIAAQKGSYDPAYAAAKSALQGFIKSISTAFIDWKVNSISLGLVENSPVYNGMSETFRQKHRDRMHNKKLIQPEEVAAAIFQFLRNSTNPSTEILLNGDFKI